MDVMRPREHTALRPLAEPTTLITFLFEAPPEPRIVELLGSWDNFEQPYRMHHDRRRGKGHWSGCFKFENIIFDGDSLHQSKPRSGGLKQGGLYWYYYRLDYDIETHDFAKEWTANCPLMPGQAMNVLEVPTEIAGPPSRRRSAGFWEDVEGTLSSWAGPMAKRQTLEPSDKYAALEPPPVSRIHGRCASDLALNGRLEGRALSSAGSLGSPPMNGCEEDDGFVALQREPSKRPWNDALRPVSRHSWHSGMQSSGQSSVLDADMTNMRDESGYWSGLQSPSSNASMPSQTLFEDFDFGASAYRDTGDDALSAVYEASEAEQDTEPFRAVPPSSEPLDANSEQYQHSQISTAHHMSNSSPRDIPSALNAPEQATLSPHFPDRDTFPASYGSGQTDLDIWSPTFSAATLSSTGGFPTPFRLSDTYSSTAWTASGDERELDDIIDRLESLDAASTNGGQSPPEHGQLAQAAFTGYALPRPAPPSVHRLDKISSPAESFSLDLPEPSFMRSNEGESMADNIFSELGYLGGSIS
ncbi:hypothetical protein B0A50_07066 [Salinomyces thailandicus]|uniref:Uncharacterized protein n=1 Tax=Salinomyces thailandicus TaxID=706561 RepID=A0A4U0TP34_9PEZI|nr:hypothetical protein B0A50_07066 [Salinomyces thailandica]